MPASARTGVHQQTVPYRIASRRTRETEREKKKKRIETKDTVRVRRKRTCVSSVRLLNHDEEKKNEAENRGGVSHINKLDLRPRVLQELYSIEK